MAQSPIEPPNNPNASSSSARSGGSKTGASRPLTFDEGIALLVAFLSLGSVLFWGLTRGGMNLLNEVTADNSALTTRENEGSEPITFDFNGDESEIAVDSGTTGTNATGTDKDTDTDDAVTTARRKPGQILEDVRTGVAGAAAGVAGTAATSQDAAANPEETESENTASEAEAESEAGDTATANTTANTEAATEDAAEANDAPAPASLSAAATGDAQEAVEFADVPDNYWAKPYIDALSSRGLISGFDDGTFRPDQPVTRAQIANIVSRTFDLTADQENLAFSDVETNFWARESIGEVVRGGFMAGFPNDTFAPNDPVTRTQSLTTLVTGLGITPPTNIQAAIDRYDDANAIPNWATEKVAAATAGGIVVNYPNQEALKPTEPTTRAELAAIIYQALAKEGVVTPIESEYVVKP
ncbi:MAG: S-layer homology domain-containing protein [Cyanobacteria bacterium P01_D01_bin.105]